MLLLVLCSALLAVVCPLCTVCPCNKCNSGKRLCKHVILLLLLSLLLPHWSSHNTATLSLWLNLNSETQIRKITYKALPTHFAWLRYFTCWDLNIWELWGKTDFLVMCKKSKHELLNQLECDLSQASACICKCIWCQVVTGHFYFLMAWSNNGKALSNLLLFHCYLRHPPICMQTHSNQPGALWKHSLGLPEQFVSHYILGLGSYSHPPSLLQSYFDSKTSHFFSFSLFSAVLSLLQRNLIHNLHFKVWFWLNILF